MKALLNGKTILITGASSGIGEALAVEAAIRGGNIVLAARNEVELQRVKGLCIEMGAKCEYFVTDVSREEDCKQLIEKTIEKYGKIDVLINNAGISMRALFSEVDLIVLEKLMQVNFWGAVYCTKYALPYLLKLQGSVVVVSSIAGYKGLPARTGYSASKFALQGFFECLRIENMKKGLHVLIACPGFTASKIRERALVADGSFQGMSPRNEGKMMSAQKTALLILNAVEKRKRKIILSFQGKMTVFLNCLFPSWTDKLVYRHISKEIDSPVK
ncbi:MAG: SDR family oxidoreductase [Bacteroidales bacterium]|nr:SDR family oxidoreductase [Bacteroidales bacterium]